jgi:hypothetical protein
VPREAVLIEQQVGGDEIDCIANISGELVLFELKDKEFNLGNAYSFGAKIGIIRPKYPVIISTEHVGNDAKEHFKRAQLARTAESRYSSDADDENPITYIEGVDSLRAGIEQFVTNIYKSDAVALVNQVLPLASFNPGAIVRALESGSIRSGAQPSAAEALVP